MDPERAASALDEHLEIALGLRGLHDAECILLARHWHVHAIVARDLEEHAGVRSALVGLARRVQEARPESETRRHPISLADRASERLELALVRGVHLDVGQERGVVAGPK